MYKEIAANKRKTVVIMLLFIAVAAGLGWLTTQFLDGPPILTIYVLIGAAIYTLISYFMASKMAMGLNGAHPIKKKDNPRLYRIVENLAITEGVPTPKIYIIEDPALNAFATGRNPNKAIVGVTTGLLDALEDAELQGVMAHELGHIKNYDIRVGLIAFALAAVIGILADTILRLAWFADDEDSSPIFFVIGIVAALLAPFVAVMIQMAVSRKREFLADATGALTTRYPEGLARALEKIKVHGSATKRPNTATAHLFFANPLSKKQFATLFSTHPPIDERIARLQSMDQ
jgi:heat shock protein HtpX